MPGVGGGDVRPLREDRAVLGPRGARAAAAGVRRRRRPPFASASRTASAKQSAAKTWSRRRDALVADVAPAGDAIAAPTRREAPGGRAFVDRVLVGPARRPRAGARAPRRSGRGRRLCAVVARLAADAASPIRLRCERSQVAGPEPARREVLGVAVAHEQLEVRRRLRAGLPSSAKSIATRRMKRGRSTAAPWRERAACRRHRGRSTAARRLHVRGAPH